MVGARCAATAGAPVAAEALGAGPKGGCALTDECMRSSGRASAGARPRQHVSNMNHAIAQFQS